MKSRHGTLPLRVVREFHVFPVVLVAEVPEPGDRKGAKRKHKTGRREVRG